VEVLGLGLGLGVVEVDHLGPGTGALVGVLVLLLAHLALGPAPPVGELASNVRREEEQVVEHCHNGDQCQERVAGEQVLEHGDEEVGRVNPRQPLGLYGDDEEQQELQVGIQGGKGEEHGHVHIVHGRRAHKEAQDDVQNHPEEVKDGELIAPPLPLQGRADEVVEVQGEDKEENIAAAGGYKDKGDDPPDLPLEDGAGIKTQQSRGNGIPVGAEEIEQVHQHIADDNVPHEPGDTQAGVFVTETVQPLLQGAQGNDLLHGFDKMDAQNSGRGHRMPSRSVPILPAFPGEV